MQTFYPFPRTLHLPGSVVIDSDRTTSLSELQRLCDECEIIIQEKIDGANVSVYASDQGTPVCQKRSGLIDAAGKQREQYAFYRNWVWEHWNMLQQILSHRFVLFGEFCWQRHAIQYTRLPDWILFFDIFDRNERVFLPLDSVAGLLQDDFQSVPQLWRGRGSVSDLMHRIEEMSQESSEYTDAECREGLYVRFEAAGAIRGRAKWRRPGFQPGANDMRLNGLAISS